MSHQPPPELFAERPVRSDFGRKRPAGIPYAVRRVISLMVLGCVIGGIAYGLYSFGNKAGNPAAIPTIKAEGNYKQKPQQPGGIDIPHQDVEVYRSIDSGEGGNKPEVEHLLPGPEVPQIPEAGATTMVTAPVRNAPAPGDEPESLMPPDPVVKKIETTVTPQASAPAAAPAPTVTATAMAEAVAPAPQANVSVTPAAPAAPVVDAAPAAPAVTPAPAPAVTKGRMAVQLTSIPDQGQAETTMARLQAKYANILGGAKLRVVRADLGAKGIYYRIQSQGLSEQQADRICSMLKGQNAGCILVRQ